MVPLPTDPIMAAANQYKNEHLGHYTQKMESDECSICNALKNAKRRNKKTNLVT
jgi:hypothetical protein